MVEATRQAGVGLILYASGSGVYGDLGELEAPEDHGPLVPSSTYGASKLAGEAMLLLRRMFGLTARAFRFGNVVGPRQTHGVGFDFVRRLLDDPTQLRILGDGQQSKSYIHVEDVIEAVLLAGTRPRRRSRSTTSPPATTSPSPRSPRWPSRCSGSSRAPTTLRLHRRRPRLEGRRARRAPRHRPHPRPGLGATSAPARQALRDSMARDGSTTPARGAGS